MLELRLGRPLASQRLNIHWNIKFSSPTQSTDATINAPTTTIILSVSRRLLTPEVLDNRRQNQRQAAHRQRKHHYSHDYLGHNWLDLQATTTIAEQLSFSESCAMGYLYKRTPPAKGPLPHRCAWRLVINDRRLAARRLHKARSSVLSAGITHWRP